jgi:hypothetical protein
MTKKLVRAFTPEEEKQVHYHLGQLARVLRVVPGGGKIEEDYWSHIYRKVRGAPGSGWSNLPMRDYCHSGLGVEMKLLKRDRPFEDQGASLMHPAATRTIDFDPREGAEKCKIKILRQFGTKIAEFRERVKATCGEGVEALVRWGIFLWSPDLDQFLYFEELLEEPIPNDFWAEFVTGSHRGNPTKNLWIFEKATDKKRYSVTMPNKGAKLQPYFDVPRIGGGAYGFEVPRDAQRPLWLYPTLVEHIERLALGRDINALVAEAIEHYSVLRKADLR